MNSDLFFPQIPFLALLYLFQAESGPLMHIYFFFLVWQVCLAEWRSKSSSRHYNGLRSHASARTLDLTHMVRREEATALVHDAFRSHVIRVLLLHYPALLLSHFGQQQEKKTNVFISYPESTSFVKRVYFLSHCVSALKMKGAIRENMKSSSPNEWRERACKREKKRKPRNIL